MAAETVAVLGGTFDPVHLGHLAVAEQIRRALALDRVLLLPTAVPPHKPAEALAPAADRETMLRLAIAGRPGLEICDLELDERRPSYSIDTLRRLRDAAPPLRPLFVVGTDTLLTLDTWREWEALLREFDLLAVDRPGHELDRVRERLRPEIASRLVALRSGGAPPEEPPGGGGRVYHLPTRPLPVSSSEIRRRAAAGESLDRLVPPAVAGYIHETGLYRPGTR